MTFADKARKLCADGLNVMQIARELRTRPAKVRQALGRAPRQERSRDYKGPRTSESHLVDRRRIREPKLDDGRRTARVNEIAWLLVTGKITRGEFSARLRAAYEARP